jgi:hypothetical protein
VGKASMARFQLAQVLNGEHPRPTSFCRASAYHVIMIAALRADRNPCQCRNCLRQLRAIVHSAESGDCISL